MGGFDGYFISAATANDLNDELKPGIYAILPVYAIIMFIVIYHLNIPSNYIVLNPQNSCLVSGNLYR